MFTIQDISERASVSRRTFYRYYNSKEEILSEYVQNLIKKYGDEIRLQHLENFESFIAYFFHYWNHFEKQLFILQKAGLFTYVLNEFNEVIAELYTSNAVPWHIDEEKDSREVFYTTRYGVGGLWNVYGSWLAIDRQNITIDEVVKILIQSFRMIKNKNNMDSREG